MSQEFTQDQFEVTLTIPSYKESNRLPVYLSTLSAYLPKDMKIIIVDDGSPKEDFELLKKRIDPFLGAQIELKRYEHNRGKGGAIEYGLDNSNTKWFGFLDADGSISAKEVVRIWDCAKATEEFDLILSVRGQNNGCAVYETYLRKLFRKIFVFYLKLLYQTPIQDSQCGYKLFKQSLYRDLQKNILNKGWLWDTELLILAHRLRKKYLEIPIDWRETSGSKVHLIADSVRMLIGLWQFKKIAKLIGMNP
jgi:dolichyl-phosphate beta-glucosyltransferase